MDTREILMQEYNNLWNEKILHKQSIRKFHNYLTYITAISSVALTFNGLSMGDFFKATLNPQNATNILQNTQNIVNILFIVLTPIVIITLTFRLNDIFHIFVIGSQIGMIENRINSEAGDNKLLLWEHAICPVIYGGKNFSLEKHTSKMSNIIELGDTFLLYPIIAFLCIFSTIEASMFIYSKIGCLLTIACITTIIYMLTTFLLIGLKLKKYIKPEGEISQAIQSQS